MTAAEHEIDFGCPGADSLDRRELGKRQFRGFQTEGEEIEPAGDDGVRNARQRIRLGARQSEIPPRFFREGCVGFRCQDDVAGMQAPPDRLGARSRNHLRNNNVGKSLKSRLAQSERYRSCLRDDLPQARIETDEGFQPFHDILVAANDPHPGSNAPYGSITKSVAEESMTASFRQKPVFRFAPSPNGPLHLGHALSALLNYDMAKQASGRFLLRIEDIDRIRCTPEFEAGIYEDLAWLGLSWEEPARRQSDHFGKYREALEALVRRGLVYPSFSSRGEVKAWVAAYEAEGKTWPVDPDGSPLYPPRDRDRDVEDRQAMLAAGLKHAWRLDMRKAIAEMTEQLCWTETGDDGRGEIAADPSTWGDVVLSRSDAPSSYHLSVVVDDALQGVTHVVRGLDLFHATSVHRLLQVLLGLPQPVYHHHRLICGPDGRKLSKSLGDTGLAELRGKGLSAADIRRLVGL